ncbi:hypothetical protein M5C72_05490 [Companilactobacillus allii]|uniref:Uncharacterized protein n=1 Tax=Companilactobacillus allii TaxID=1847728 RepID=A0A1P8Q439_9LACO|nr:hypothetical protein [Companilactobacillus allii]APX72569.1 hypothetical protein BTM29_08405 [Companilactobacillus allii]USQ69670.1 hypothetical protein M5C72_05490 [Companilactobacillus allii]
MKREYSFFITVSFIVIDLIISLLTRFNVVSTFVGVTTGVLLIAILILITRVFTKLDMKKGKTAFSFLAAVFVLLIFGPLLLVSSVAV